MFHISHLPDSLPLFPLPGALLLPRTRLPLNIFEPRYLSMIDHVLKSDHRLLGMVQPTQDGTDKLQKIGCAGRLVSLAEAEGNRYLITLRGISRFEISKVKSGFSPYLMGDLNWAAFSDDLNGKAIDTEFDRMDFLSKLKEYFAANNLTSNWDELQNADEEVLINSLSTMCPFDVSEKQALLEAKTLQHRRKTLEALMEFSMRQTGDGPERLQ